ncbi:MAG TPA: Asp-tRNA(Asn)/Glu-tRNA(Gln) amidotransferase subunit GatC [Patescibacteria group bacterium]|nr:Asp-tRNA(Asn)/Glu-tRNA(Gln) amidotransferase subunit GatC [Patescibacteria group bacterium]
MKIDVPHVAKLANLKLSANQIKTFEKQLQSILNYIDKLGKVNTEKVEETSQVTGLENVTRNDETSPSLSQEEALSNTKSQHNGLFKVKGIFNND